MPHFIIVLILYINLLNLSWIKMSIFEEYRASKLVWTKYESYILHTSAVMYTFQNLNTVVNDKVRPWPRQKVKLRKGCVLLKSLTLKLEWAKSCILNTSTVTNTFQNLNAELQHGFKCQSMTWTWPKGCVVLKGLTLRLLSAKTCFLNTSAVMNTFQNLNTELQHGFKEQSMTWTWPRQKVKLRKGYVLLKGLTLRLVWAKY